MTDGFASLADAARASFPPQHVRIVAMREHGDAGYVLFDTRPSGPSYLYGVNYGRAANGRWGEGSSSNGAGWSQIGTDVTLGTQTFWDDAPDGADRVRVEFMGEVREEPVVDGAYLVVWWNVPGDIDTEMRVQFSINGRWVEALW